MYIHTYIHMYIHRDTPNLLYYASYPIYISSHSQCFVTFLSHFFIDLFF